MHEHHNPLLALRFSPTLHYVLSCAFLFYVFMCATLLETLVGFNARRFIQEHEWLKHVIAGMLLLFTIGALNVLPSLASTLAYTVLVYVWFLLMSKLPGAWSTLIMAILLVGFVLNELIMRHYTAEWVYSSTPYTGDSRERTAEMHAHPANQQRNRLRNCLIRITRNLGGVVLALTGLLVLWFYSSLRRRGLKDVHGSFWRFVYQPNAVMAQDLASGFSSQALLLDEKFDLDNLVAAVAARLRELPHPPHV
jgi:hypothetical protein